MRSPDALRTLVGRMNPFIQKAGNYVGGYRSSRVRTLEVAYVILLSDEAHNYMRKLEVEILKRYGPHEGLKATPHITLKLGFHVSDMAPFEEYFDKLVAEIEPFEICIKNFGFFDDMGIVFMDVTPTPQLERLRRRIVSDLSERHGIKPSALEGDQYHYHATLAYLSKEDFVKARREFEDMKVEFRFMLDTVGLLCHADESWVTYKRARLTQNSASIVSPLVS